MSEPVKLITSRPDSERAKDLKRAVPELLVKICELLDEAGEAGLAVNFQLGRDWRGKNVIANFNVVKVL